MESYGEVGIIDYMRLMKHFLAGNISAKQYTKSYFSFNKKRISIPNELANQVILYAHGDADDYESDPELRLKDPQWINESQLKERVAKSLHELEALGYPAQSGSGLTD